ncbi:unnamed protein product [Prorocentrum cordatum]|uniref:Uncharacterized protein n=1 Tax=Prorocentrum cordatum TaxID=2364126 RepID=A0ABN9UXN8_9DINO|nr:unnamed protein product [Polarella glacialis]
MAAAAAAPMDTEDVGTGATQGFAASHMGDATNSGMDQTRAELAAIEVDEEAARRTAAAAAANLLPPGLPAPAAVPAGVGMEVAPILEAGSATEASRLLSALRAPPPLVAREALLKEWIENGMFQNYDLTQPVSFVDSNNQGQCLARSSDSGSPALRVRFENRSIRCRTKASKLLVYRELGVEASRSIEGCVNTPNVSIYTQLSDVLRARGPVVQDKAVAWATAALAEKGADNLLEQLIGQTAVMWTLNHHDALTRLLRSFVRRSTHAHCPDSLVMVSTIPITSGLTTATNITDLCAIRRLFETWLPIVKAEEVQAFTFDMMADSLHQFSAFRALPLLAGVQFRCHWRSLLILVTTARVAIDMISPSFFTAFDLATCAQQLRRAHLPLSTHYGPKGLCLRCRFLRLGVQRPWRLSQLLAASQPNVRASAAKFLVISDASAGTCTSAMDDVYKRSNDACAFHPAQAVTAADGARSIQEGASEIGVVGNAFCLAQRSNQHGANVVLGIQGGRCGDQPRYWICNIQQHCNGSCLREHIFGVLVDVRAFSEGCTNRARAQMGSSHRRSRWPPATAGALMHQGLRADLVAPIGIDWGSGQLDQAGTA